MGGDSCSEGRRFKSRHRILDGHFFTFICSKIYNVCLERQNKLKRGRGWPILKKTINTPLRSLDDSRTVL